MAAGRKSLFTRVDQPPGGTGQTSGSASSMALFGLKKPTLSRGSKVFHLG